MRRLYGAQEQGPQTHQIACFCKPHGSPAMLGSPVGAAVGMSQQRQTLVHVELSLIHDLGTCDEWTCMTNIQATKNRHN